MTVITSREWALANRPVGAPTASDFTAQTNEAPAPKDGQIQVRNSWMSVDPYMRGRMYDRESYVPLASAISGPVIPSSSDKMNNSRSLSASEAR